MKRLICTIAVIMVLSTSAQAQYSGGSGTSGDPYQIATAADLVTLGADTNDYDKCFILTADIAIGAFTNSVIAPDTDSSTISFDGPKFTGFFNGQWHKISGLQINGPGLYYIGLFGAIGSGGWVENLRLDDVTINGLSYVGGLAGVNQGIIHYCSSSGHVVSGDYSEFVGGLVGYEDGTIYYILIYGHG